MVGLQAMAGQAEAAQATVGRALALAGDMGENRVAALARVRRQRPVVGRRPGAAATSSPGIRSWSARASRAWPNLTADLAHVLHQLGRPDEALHTALASRAIAADDDLFAQVRWRGAAARSLALQGRLDDAERLAAEAVGIASETDMLTMHGDALLDQAAVAVAAARPADGPPRRPGRPRPLPGQGQPPWRVLGRGRRPGGRGLPRASGPSR